MKLYAKAALVAAVMCVGALPLVGQQGPAPAAQSPAAGRAGGRGGGNPAPPQGGTGPIKMLLITKTHPFDREPFYQMYDSFGADVTSRSWTRRIQSRKALAMGSISLTSPTVARCSKTRCTRCCAPISCRPITTPGSIQTGSTATLPAG